MKKNKISAFETDLDVFAGWRHVVSWVASFIHSVLENKKWSCEFLSSAVCGAVACLRASREPDRQRVFMWSVKAAVGRFFGVI